MVVEGTAFATDAAVEALHAIAPFHDDGLRDVEPAMHQATLFAGTERPTFEHLS